MHALMYILSFLLLSGIVAFSQSGNVGIGTDNPSEKLEVSGLMYTNQGGIKFPDETVQTTAAFNADPEDAAEVRGGGLIKIGNLLTGIDSLGLQDVSVLYDMEFNIQVNPSGGGGSGSSPIFSRIRVLKDINIASISLFEHASEGTFIPEVEIFLVREVEGGPEYYYRIRLIGVKLGGFSNVMVHLGQHQYGHVEELEFVYEQIEIINFDTGQGYCYNVATTSPCN